MKIESIILRPSGTQVTFSVPAPGRDVTYLFTGPVEGPHVCEVEDEADIARLLAVPQYREYRDPLTPEEAALVRAQAEAAAEAQRKIDAAADADRLAAEAEADRLEQERIARTEAAALALLENRATIAEAEAIAAGRAPVPDPVAPTEAERNPLNLPDEATAAAEALRKAEDDRLRAEQAERGAALDSLDMDQARARYLEKFGKRAHPAMKLDKIIQALGV